MSMKIVKHFLDYLFKLPVSDQAVVYGALGEELNRVLLEKTKEKNDLQNIDLEKLLKTSATDSRYASDENKNKKRITFCLNIVQHFLKARNLKYVSLTGLSVMTLIYIFSGRSKQTCNLFSTTGAKGIELTLLVSLSLSLHPTSALLCIALLLFCFVSP